ncbi:MAG: ATP-binding protein [Eubacteriales bacterium]
MAKVIILVGKIASGKTTWVNDRKKQKQMMLLSCDDLMLNLFARCLGEKHGETERRCLKFLFGQAVELTEMGIDVVLDSGFWTKASRKAAKEYFAAMGIETNTYYFKIPDETRIDRLERRNEQLAQSTKREYIIEKSLLARLDKNFEEPLPNEYDFLVTD